MRVSLQEGRLFTLVDVRRLWVTFAVCIAFLGAPSAAAADAPWQWDQGHAWWGWNYVTPTVNTWVAGPWNYWDLHRLQLGSGGSVDYAFYSLSTNDWCYEIRWIPGTYHMTPGEDGPCGGYNRPYVGYYDGPQSYLRSDTFVI